MKNNSLKFASIDIGGTNTRFAIFENDKIIKKIKFSTNQNDYKETLDKICNLLDEYNISGVGLCIPGPADYENGIILTSPNLQGWNGKDIKKYILENSKVLEIAFENDANVMALSNHVEFNQGERDITQFFTISTGLGAGLVINNKIFTGSKYLAQEIARAPIAPISEPGFHLPEYSLELFCSGTGFALRYEKATNIKKSTKEICEAYLAKNDSVAYKIISEGIEVLARLISISIAFVNPNLISFGGSVTEFNKWFVEEAIQRAKSWTEENQFNSVRFVFDKNGDDSALFGLNYLIKSKFAENKRG